MLPLRLRSTSAKGESPVRLRDPFIWFTGLWLLGALLLAPPGGSACWPWSGGRHLHVGWSRADGQDALHLTAFAHGDSQSVANSRPPSLAPAQPAGSFASADLIPPSSNALWLLPVLTLWWLLSEPSVNWRQPSVPPITPPPRAV